MGSLLTNIIGTRVSSVTSESVTSSLSPTKGNRMLKTAAVGMRGAPLASVQESNAKQDSFVATSVKG